MNRIFSLLLIVAVLAGCQRQDTLRDMPDAELSERVAACLDAPPTAPAFGHACENLKRECQRRRSEGRMVCPLR